MPVPAHPATETRASPADLFEVIVVRAGTVLFAIDVQAAVEIRGPERFGPADLHGRATLEVRGQPLPVVDLRRMSGQPAFGGGSPAMLLINAGTAPLALAVDEVLEIEAPDATTRVPERAAGQSFGFCSGHIQLDPARSAALIEPVALLAALATQG
ncbi:chemotaxis protein CheW [Stenotrophomonas maltophilia]|uniref:chemotaxis protein CheW n=2 Tax=Lysobacteraceae TaxID=32033 RepID=UPI00122F5F22|nr:chemotaxis protein CheW [Stenotrophomonas maltophilia]MBN5125115.1 chemotaxis protein CheW [Stenotrophomonas maltophilia]MBN5175865.1 chemotaxis protein CheW [Stenotrophomonas maltophilia]MCU1121759.1 chemotaxis protein CheW [Stenotrophomonas maltophilia]